MKRLISICLIVCLILVVIGCGGGGGNSGDGSLSKINITDATTLLIAPATTAEQHVLYKITQDGRLEQVKSFDSNGRQTSSTINPFALFNVNNQYLIIVLREKTLTGYLVRKTDGAVFSLASVGYPYEIMRGKSIQTDGLQNIYYVTTTPNYDRILIKLNTQNINRITKTKISLDIDDVDNFRVDSVGNVIYSYNFSNKQNRLIPVSGGATNIGKIVDEKTGHDREVDGFYLGLDDKFYVIRGWGWGIYKITINLDGSVVEEKVCDQMDSGLVPVGKELYCRDRVYLAAETIYDVSSVPPCQITTPYFSPNFIDATSEHIYLGGEDNNSNSVIYKLDPTTDYYEKLFESSDYEIYNNNMVLLENGEIIFGAYKDRTYVIGKIQSDGQLTIIDETLNMEIIKLEAIQ